MRSEILLRCADAFDVGSVGGERGLHHEEVMIVKATIHTTRDLCCLGTEGRASTFQEDDGHDATDFGVCIRGKPPEAGSSSGASTSLTQDFFFIEVQLDGARGSVGYGASHAIRDFWNQFGDIEMAFDARLKVSNVFRAVGVLQVVKRS